MTSGFSNYVDGAEKEARFSPMQTNGGHWIYRDGAYYPNRFYKGLAQFDEYFFPSSSFTTSGMSLKSGL
jgi:hypothetical protein